jgi:glutathione S-transferase
MSTAIKPIKVLGVHGPNAQKVNFLCEQLGLPYETVDIPFSDVKKPDYVAVNPNGRLPSIQDPNNDLTLWESGAILEYLTEIYDKENKLSFPAGSVEYQHARQWLFYQTTGQGPYYGQAIWFMVYQPIQEARDRYIKEINRVTGVLEAHLAKQTPDQDGNRWFVGGRFSYVDIAFSTWQNIVSVRISKDEYDHDSYPQVKKWLETVLALPAAKKIVVL